MGSLLFGCVSAFAGCTVVTHAMHDIIPTFPFPWFSWMILVQRWKRLMLSVPDRVTLDMISSHGAGVCLLTADYWAFCNCTAPFEPGSHLQVPLWYHWVCPVPFRACKRPHPCNVIRVSAFCARVISIRLSVVGMGPV